MDKEKIEKFDKEQLELLLNDLQDIDKFTGFKNGAFKYELGKYQASLLVNCIEKQKEVIDNTIGYINKYESIRAYYEYIDEDGYVEYDYDEDFKKEILDILNEVTNNE